MALYLYIRFSTRRQKDGNSIRRQIDYGRAFCLRENLPFDPDSQTLSDEGTSGFRGLHRQEGRAGGLSEFLARCESGQITRGSYLLVESLDRLTREHPLDAMDLLRQLLREYGIILVVMRPEMKLTSQSLGQLEGIIAFLEAMRAHGESARKSDMSRYNWEVKRAEASTKPVTARVPSWLTVEDGKIVPVKEKVKAVRRIFELARKGYGHTLIVRKLNKESVPPISPAGFWEETYVGRILKSRAVLGEFQPRMLVEGRLTPVGPVIKEYFPTVVKPEEWNATRQAIAERRRTSGKPSVKAINLFSGLVRMGGEKATFKDKSGIKYLCPADHSHPGVRLDHLERAVLHLLVEVRLNLDSETGVDLLRQEAAELDRSVRVLQAQIDADHNMRDMLPTLAKWRGQLSDLSKKIEAAAVPLSTSFVHSQRLIELLRAAGDEDRERLRRELRQTIRYVVAGIDVEVAGKRWKSKSIRAIIHFKDGKRRAAYYKVREGRFLGGGLGWSPDAPDLTSSFKAFVDVTAADGVARTPKELEEEAQERMYIPPDPPPFRRRGKKLDAYEPISMTTGELKAKCRELKANGLSMPKIGEKLGISRITVWRYLHNKV